MTAGRLPALGPDEEKALVSGIVAGRAAAFEQFYRLYAAPLFRFAKNWLPHEDAEEVVDDVLLQSSAYIEDYDSERAGPSGLALWLIVRCRSRVLDRARKLQLRTIKAQKSHGDSVPLHEDLAYAMTIAAPDDTARDVETRSEFTAYWTTLSQQERDVVALHYYYGLSYDEVATRMGVKLSTVHEYAKRARAKLPTSVTLHA